MIKIKFEISLDEEALGEKFKKLSRSTKGILAKNLSPRVISSTIILSLILAFGINLAFAAWTDPTCDPSVDPGACNAEAPLNVSSTGQTKTGNLTLPNLYLNATGAEGDIYNIDEIIGNDDLFLKGNSAETAPVYVAGNRVSLYTSGTERLRITSGGTVRITGLTNCDTIDTDASGNLSCGVDAAGAGGDGYLPVDPPTIDVSMANHRLENLLAADSGDDVQRWDQIQAWAQKDILSNCGAGDYVYGVSDNGDLLCRADQTGAGGITGSGTANYIAKFTGADSLGNSRLQDTGGAHVDRYSGHSTITGMRFYDAESTLYGYVYGSNDGANFGLLDGDGNWSYLAVKDNYTQFRINNSTKMHINSGGNVGIGTTSPATKLDVQGTITIGAGGDIYSDANWLRLNQTHTQNISTPRIMRADSGFNVDGNTVIDGNARWHRVHCPGSLCGFYNQTYNGGWYMSDSTWVRSYANKSVYTGGEMQAPTVRGSTQLCIGSACRTTWPSGADGNNYTTGISFSGAGTTKTLTLTRSGMSGLAASFTETDTLDSVTDRGNSTTNNIDANRFRANGNTGYYLDPDGTSKLNVIDAVRMRDKDNTAYDVDPAGTSDMNVINTAGKVTVGGNLVADNNNHGHCYDTAWLQWALTACSDGYYLTRVLLREGPPIEIKGTCCRL